MSNQWHYSQDGAQYGPVDESEIVRLIQDGELPPSTPVCKEGGMDWQPARSHACFQVEVYPKKKASKQTAASSVSKSASGRTSQSPRRTAAATPSPSVSFPPKVTNPVLAPVTSGKSFMSGATIACLIIMSIISIGSVYFSVSQGRKINELELLNDLGKNLLISKNKLKKDLTNEREKYSEADSARTFAVKRAKDLKEENIKLLKTANSSDRLLLSLKMEIKKLEAAEQKRIEELENWKKKAKKVPGPAPNPKLAQEYFKLGKMYRYGEGVPKDKRKAANQYGLAAAQGHTEAEYTVGVMYENGEGFGEISATNDKEAVKWYRKAAEKGYNKAQNNLGEMYRKGRGVEKNDKEAVKWFRKAAEQGMALAQNNIGYMYENGKGVARDDKEAMKWYRKAQKLPLAQSNIGFMYENGKGVGRDRLIAYAWYSIAATNGDTLGKEKKAEVAKKLSPAQKNSAQEYARTLMKRIGTP
jgi:TPR repeat protein